MLLPIQYRGGQWAHYSNGSLGADTKIKRHRRMAPSGPCRELGRLLQQVSRAVDKHAVAATRMSAFAGRGDGFFAAKAQAADAQQQVQAAMKDYEKHVREHGC